MLELLLRVGFSLCLVLGLIWAAARLSSRRLAGGPRALVRVRGRQALSRTSSVAVVEVGSRLLVIGVSDGGVRLLTELDPEDVDVPVSDAAPALPGVASAASTGPLGGSLLAPGTWKQAWAAATRRQGLTLTEALLEPDARNDRA
jgi:flagellar protein FliO/FliZ